MDPRPTKHHPPPWQPAPVACSDCGEALPEDAFFCGACGASRHEDPRLGQVVLERYRLVEEIGAGGMGSVYRAEQRVGRFTREVAVKVLHASFAEAQAVRARFHRECELVTRLSHPNTIRFYDFGELEDGALAIVMELVEGEPLSARVERGPLPLHEALSILGQIAGALDEAHAAGIVHRDLKPDNVLLFERPGAEGPGVKVLDFGVAKAPELDPDAPALTFRGEVIGTPAYMSPEQIAGRPLDARSDVYAFGVLAYELLTGALPFEGADSLLDWAERHLVEAPTPIASHPVSLPPQVQLAVMRALSKEPEARPDGVKQMMREMRTAPSSRRRSSAPLEPSETGEIVLPLARTNRRVAGWAAAALAGLVALGASLAGEPSMPSAKAPEAKLEVPAATVAACEADAETAC